MNKPQRTFFATAVWVDGHWLPDARIGLSDDGRVVSLQAGQTPCDGDIHCSWLIPAMTNAHSHVFQRAMAGQAEFRDGDRDDFWSWRQRMYALANGITPEELHDLACWSYAGMQALGYTHVCEFHYVHRSGSDGRDTTAMAEALLAAANTVGIGITLLPVLYRYSGFGAQALLPEQRRFGLSVDEYLDVLTRLQTRLVPGQRLGVCFHSLRAVSQDDMRVVLNEAPDHWPVHLHIAEQILEVEQCQQTLGARPVAWLLDNFPVSARWNLVHATHMTSDEAQALAATGAVAVLCPSTEANLGDGVFPLPAYQAAGGHYSLGSDSNVELNPARECQLLEYSQRLLLRQRVVAGHEQNIRPARAIHAGDALWQAASRGGQQSATGQPPKAGLTGTQANWIELDEAHPLLNLSHEAQRLDRFVFAAPEAVKRVWQSGQCVAVAGEPLAAEGYRQQGLCALASLKDRGII